MICLNCRHHHIMPLPIDRGLVSFMDVPVLRYFSKVCNILFTLRCARKGLVKCIERFMYCVWRSFSCFGFYAQSITVILFQWSLFLSQFLYALFHFRLLDFHHQVTFFEIARQGLKLLFIKWFILLLNNFKKIIRTYWAHRNKDIFFYCIVLVLTIQFLHIDLSYVP